MLVTFLCLCAVLSFVQGDDEYNDFNETIEYDICTSEFKYANNINELINVTESCNHLCLAKCCPANHMLVLERADPDDYGNLTCVESKYVSSLYNLTNMDDYSDVVFYENNIKQYISESKVKLDKFTEIYRDDFVSDNCFVDVKDAFPDNEVYILENGTAVIRHNNFFNQWKTFFTPGEFCLGHQIVVEAGSVSKPGLVIRILAEGGGEADDSFDKNTLTAIAMLVSCVFLLLVLAVYALLKQLRNLAGLMLMTYVATLTANFMLRAAQVLLTDNMQLPKTTCIWLGLVAHYTLVASFTWMNVMSFDIWWSMRGFRKMRQIHRRGVLVKFCWYSLYGWGAPLLLTLFMVIVENLNLARLPNFVKSNYLNEVACFIEADETMLYLDCPILITTCINIMLFLMTAYNIWRIKHGVAQHNTGNSRRNKKDESRCAIYLKLSLLMGITWILEAVSAFYKSDSVWWYAPDVFNSLTGLFIFIIFICKRSIIVQLCKRLKIGHGIIRKLESVDASYNDTRLNSKNSRSSRRKMQNSVTETSDIYAQERKYYFEHVDLRSTDKPS